MVVSETISYTDFLHFFQKSIDDVFYANNLASGELIHQVPPVALALRLTVEMFRVLSQDKGKVTVITMVDYVNSTELFPLTIAQLLDLFDMYGPQNIENSKSRAQGD